MIKEANHQAANDRVNVIGHNIAWKGLYIAPGMVIEKTNGKQFRVTSIFKQSTISLEGEGTVEEI